MRRAHMWTGWIRAAVAAAVLLCALPGGSPQVEAAPQAPVGERRVALIIGNGSYKESPLKNPVNDSRAIAQRFKKMGFEVIALENATQAQMNKAITQFSEKLTEQGAAIFYYAGHGMQVKGRNFLVPVDADITSEASVRNSAVDVDQLLEAIGEPSKRTNIVILDACRNNPFGRFRGGGSGLAQVSAPAGTLVAYATAPGMTAADGDGQNGAYTAEILKALDEPGLRVEDVFKKVRVNVAQATGNAQVPWEASSLVGDFYFVPKGSSVVVVPPGGQIPSAAPPSPQNVEMTFWDGIKGSKDPSLYKAYLDKYPNGSFAPIAQSRLAQLTAPAPAAPAPAGSAPPQVASLPPPASAPPAGKTTGLARYDGTWEGIYACGKSDDGNLPESARQPWTTADTKLYVANGTVTGGRTWVFFGGKRTGSDHFNGSVGDEGVLTMSGRGVFNDSGGGYKMAFHGKIEGDKLTAEGTHAARACKLDFTRSSRNAPPATAIK